VLLQVQRDHRLNPGRLWPDRVRDHSSYRIAAQHPHPRAARSGHPRIAAMLFSGSVCDLRFYDSGYRRPYCDAGLVIEMSK
jgi:hypothetical protein